MVCSGDTWWPDSPVVAERGVRKGAVVRTVPVGFHAPSSKGSYLRSSCRRQNDKQIPLAVS